jgi:lipopolysaccharide biosynthesis glycosyltransferase
MEIFNPAFKENNIIVIFSSSNFFSAYLAVCIQSIIAVSSSEYNYDIIVMEREITAQNKSKINNLIGQHKNISIRFKNVKTQVSNLKFYINGSRLSQETYYGLLIPWLLPDFNKAIIMDCDMIVKRDIADLYNIDIGDNVGAGVRDVNIQIWINDKKMDVDDYYKNKLKVHQPCNCFNGGLILLDFSKYRKNYTIDEIADYLENYHFRVVDQDIFNILLQDKIKLIELGWNHMIRIDDDRLLLANESIRNEYIKARQNPYIIHYAGEIKPWNDPDAEFGDDFWQIARKTLFYELIIARMNMYYTDKVLESHTISRHKDYMCILKYKCHILVRRIVRIFFSANGEKYKKLKCFYYKLRGQKVPNM